MLFFLNACSNFFFWNSFASPLVYFPLLNRRSPLIFWDIHHLVRVFGSLSLSFCDSHVGVSPLIFLDIHHFVRVFGSLSLSFCDSHVGVKCNTRASIVFVSPIMLCAKGKKLNLPGINFLWCNIFDFPFSLFVE
ncbi:hypothetical protein AMTRI_Chr06g195330 [Amborella trichopoda]